MKPSTELFRLIKSLSKSEKRFFKLSSSLQSGDKNYLKIFDYIEGQDVYNEGLLKVAFKNETFIKHLPSEKNHLYKLILKSLRSFHSDNGVSAMLKQELKNIEILYNKALYKECNKFLTRAKKLAIEYEEFYYLIDLISWEKMLLEEAYEAGNFDTNLDELVEEESMVIDKLRNLAEYHILYSRINALFRSGGYTKNEEERKQVEEIADNYLIKGKNTAISTRASSICYYIKGLCAATNREFEVSFLNFNKVKTILNNNEKIKADLAKRYLQTLSHLRDLYIESGNYLKAEMVIEEILALEGQKGFKSVDVRMGIAIQSCFGKLVLYNTQGNFEKSVALIPEIEKQLKQFGDNITKEKILLFQYYQAYAFFGVNDLKNALSIINDILNDNEQKLRQDIYMYARIFNLIIHYELGNYDFLDYNIKSIQRYFKKQNTDSNIEDVVIANIKTLARLGDSSDTIDTFKMLENKINKSLKASDNQAITNYFDVLAWVKSKINRTSFSKEVTAN